MPAPLTASLHNGLLQSKVNHPAQSSPNGTSSATPTTRETSNDLAEELTRLTFNADDAASARLEDNAVSSEKAYREALLAAAEQHAKVRQSAIIAQEKHQILLRLERIRREEKENRELESQRREQARREQELRERQAERLKLQQDELERQLREREAIDQATEEQARRVKSAAEDAARQKSEAEARRLEAEKNQRAIEEQRLRSQAAAEAERQRKIQEQAQLKAQPVKSAPAPVNSAVSQSTDPVHEEFIAMHKELKKVRQTVIAEGKRNEQFKKIIGEMRRNLRKSVGQLSADKQNNKVPMRSITEILERTRDDRTTPMTNIKSFLVSKPTGSRSPSAQDEDPQQPLVWIYLLNIFAKSLISQFIDEAGVAPKLADPVGIIAVSIFAREKLRWSGYSMIDILLAKFHVVCPVLWGARGSEKTVQGKARLGWWREDKDGPFVSEQRHSERMTGLGAGYAAMALRNFSRSQLINPLPNYHYWASMASIINTPANEAGMTHFMVLKAMIENFEPRFFETYGPAAKVALRKALIDFPNAAQAAGNKSVALSAVTVLPDVLKRDLKIIL